jgi:hypothetical protein
MTAGNYVYDADFYHRNRESAKRSARPILIGLLQDLRSCGLEVGSAVDVGCGCSGWLDEIKELGVNTTFGVEGEWAKPYHDQKAHTLYYGDLTENHLKDVCPDIALCLEVAEHLPESKATDLVDTLAAYSGIVLFSAAVPGQGGENHVNEQPHRYWANKFLDIDYVTLDIVRPRFWSNRSIDWWYRQNCYLMVSIDSPYYKDLMYLAASRPLLDIYTAPR